MSDLDILHALIVDEAQTSVEMNIYGKQSLVLKEANGQQAAYEIQICNIPDDIVAFKADKFPAPEAVFKGDKGECKRADFIVVAHTPKENWIIYIEMKKGNSASAKEIVQQLKGAKCLLTYCRAIGRTFWQVPEFLNGNYRERFVSIKNIGLNKRPTRTPPISGVHEKPENMLKISSPGQSLQFRELVES